MSRKIPYPQEMFTSKKWVQYWYGKPSFSKEAVEEYLKKYGTEEAVTQNYLAMKHGVTGATIIRHIANLKKEGIIPQGRHATKKPTGKEVAMRYSIFFRDGKPYDNYYEKQKSLGYVLCSNCVYVKKKHSGSGDCSLRPEKKISIESWRKCKQFRLKEEA